jgi:hypothetical protein
MGRSSLGLSPSHALSWGRREMVYEWMVGGFPWLFPHVNWKINVSDYWVVTTPGPRKGCESTLNKIQ